MQAPEHKHDGTRNNTHLPISTHGGWRLATGSRMWVLVVHVAGTLERADRASKRPTMFKT